MHRIDGPGATPTNRFTEGDPVGGVDATTVTDDWLNDVQEELITLLTTAGITPVKGTQNQVLAAINAIILAVFGQGGTSANDYVKIPFRDKTTGVKREFIIQWGSYSQAANGDLHTLPIAFPTAHFFTIANDNSSSLATYPIGTSAFLLGSFRSYSDNTAPSAFQAISIGY